MKVQYVLLFILLSHAVLSQDKKAQDISADTIAILELNSSLGAPPIFYENKIYTVELSGLISSYDLSGKRLWGRNTASTLHSRPIIADTMLCAATSKNEIITLDLNNGAPVQSFGITDSITTDLTLIQYTGDKELMMPKSSYSKSSVVFGTKSGSIYCIDLETLQVYWVNKDAAGPVKSQIVAVDNRILFTSRDGFLYSIDSRNGLLNWRWKEKAETDFSNSQITCDGQKVYVIDNEFSLFSIDLLLGNFTWKSPAKVFGSVGISGDKKKLYAKGLYSKFYIISTINGKVLKGIRRYDLFESDNISPFEYNKKILFTNWNSIFSLNEKFKEEIVYKHWGPPITSFMQINKNLFLVSNSNGSIIILSIR